MIRAALVAAMLLSACGTARRGEPFTPEVKLDGQEAEGERLFMKHCHQCHPGGEGGIGPAINNKPLPRFAIHTQIRAGVGEMPSFDDSTLTEEQVSAITAYLQQLHSPKKDK